VRLGYERVGNPVGCEVQVIIIPQGAPDCVAECMILALQLELKMGFLFCNPVDFHGYDAGRVFFKAFAFADRIKKLPSLLFLMKSVIIADNEEKVRQTYARAIKHFSGGQAVVEEVGDGATLVERMREREIMT